MVGLKCNMWCYNQEFQDQLKSDYGRIEIMENRKTARKIQKLKSDYGRIEINS